MGFPRDSSAMIRCPDSNHYEFQIKTIIGKMIWDFGLSCFFPSDKQNQDQTTEEGSSNMKDHRAWLLAETAAGGGGAALSNADPQSVHSSFRFNLIEQDSLGMNFSDASATVLMVNLESGLVESHAQELQWRRIQSLEKKISPVACTLIRFCYSEILSATCNFSEGRVLGRGALGCVFRGRVGFMRTAVAVKQLDQDNEQSPKSFCRELIIASSLHNPNIAPLLGFCMDPEGGLFLVYKYVSGGSLERHLHDRKKGKKSRAPLPWSVRYKVAIGVGEAIRYLHNGTERCIVHRDIKPSNILLSSKKIPKLCDFGLASWTSAPSVPFLCKTVKGTFGYLAPEYFQHGKVSDKTDVYAFGVVLLELLTGRKPIEAKRPPGEENLVQWAKPLLLKGAEAVQDLLDPQLKCHVRNAHQILCMIQAAEACVNSEEFWRPGIDKIVAILRGIDDDEEENDFISRKSSSFSVNGRALDCYTQSQRKSEFNSHLALAMLGVPEFEDYEHLFCR